MGASLGETHGVRESEFDKAARMIGLEHDSSTIVPWHASPQTRFSTNHETTLVGSQRAPLRQSQQEAFAWGERCVTPRQACPQPNGFGRNLRSKTRWFTGFCNSHQVSHFATFFIDARAEISVAESHLTCRVVATPGGTPCSGPPGVAPSNFRFLDARGAGVCVLPRGSRPSQAGHDRLPARGWTRSCGTAHASPRQMNRFAGQTDCVRHRQ